MVNYMSEHPIQGLMGVTMGRIKEMVDVNTIIGDPITTADGTVIIPVSKVGFGFASGGSDFPSKQPKDLFGGGSGAGISIQPIAFLVINNGDVQLLELNKQQNTGEKMMSAVPDIIDKISSLIGGNKKNSDGEKTSELEKDEAVNLD